jgi:valyl-tRNA synthetase
MDSCEKTGPIMQSKHYPFNEFQTEIQHRWSEKKEHSSKGPTYTIMMPPPNVTGSLHLGHALSSTIQDILIRMKRLQGYDVLWLPGTDHAGIATQMMVEKHLEKQKKYRKNMSREEFLAHVWQWKEEHGDVIVDQMKALGFSASWSHLCFTLDPKISEAVIHAFVTLYEQGLIYRAHRLISWDPVLKTAVSDLEVVSEEKESPFWTLRYLLEQGGHIDIATTRPETIFADAAIAVHPEDERFSHLIGQMALIPLIQKAIPIIGDHAVLPEKGTGAVKVTPAHDFLDFEIGQRHQLGKIDLLDADAMLNENAPKAFQGMPVEQARKSVIASLGEAVVHTEMIVHHVPCSQRSGAILEPRLTDQWFLNTKNMAQHSIDVVRNGNIQFVPQHWQDNYFEWLENIQPWCISRQLWWGHQIPAWYTESGEIIVAKNEEAAYEKARNQYGNDVKLRQDPDVLDTWFSSALWPFSTLGWPENTSLMCTHYPTQILVTGFDIIFFWVARMIMMGTHLTGKIPFRQVFIHPLIRDEHGKKMSKTKGNVINPSDLIEEYGADATRFALSTIAVQAQYTSFGLKHIEHARNFITKIWNVTRFVLMNKLIDLDSQMPEHPEWLMNQWIIAETQNMVAEVETSLNEYQFHEAAQKVSQFAWKIFCDWYVEWIKDECHHGNGKYFLEIQATTTYVLKTLLTVLHPFMPFVTEKLWSVLGHDEILQYGKWPQVFQSQDRLESVQVTKDVDFLVDMITHVRRLKAEFALSGSVTVYARFLSDDQQRVLRQHQDRCKRFLKIAHIEIESFLKEESPLLPENVLQFAIENAMFFIPAAEKIDAQQEQKRLEKILQKLLKEKEKVKMRLDNPLLSQKAPPEIIEDLNRRLMETEAELVHILKALQTFKKTGEKSWNVD